VPIPKFGSKIEGINYVDRPGAYAVIENHDQRIAVIETSYGFFLPGGGIEPGETEIEALKREVLEEIGFRISVGEVIGAAVEYIKASKEGMCYQIRSKFYKVQLE
jgi:8-oxo-dGTP diphosphatase